MTLRSFLILTLVTFFSTATFAQSVVITPKSVTYTRKHAKSDYRKTFTVVYPKVKASTPALSRKIEAAISFEMNGMFLLRDEIGYSSWLDEADYEVYYNKNGILNIRLRTSGTAANTTYNSKSVTVDLKTGRRVRAADVFTNIAGLVAAVKKIQAENIKFESEEIKKNPDYQNEDTDELFRYANFNELDLEGFDVNDEGIAFNYDYGFPRILMMIEPSGYYQLSWDEAKPFIKPTGLLGRFVR